MTDETTPLPAAADPAPQGSTEVVPAPVVVEAAVAPPKRRRAWVVVLIVLGILLVLGVIAFLVGEGIAKDYAKDYVRAQVVQVLGLPDDAKVDVDLGGGSIILQALRGRVDRVDVTAHDATFGALTGDVRLHAEGVPLDATAPVDVLHVEFATGADDLAALQGTGADAPDLEIGDGEVALSSSFDLFGATIPWGLSLVPSAADGQLVLSPTSITIGTATFQAGEEDDSFLGQLAGALLQPQTLCVAGQVPRALVLTDAEIDGHELVLGFTADGAALGGPELATPGTCPAS